MTHEFAIASYEFGNMTYDQYQALCRDNGWTEGIQVQHVTAPNVPARMQVVAVIEPGAVNPVPPLDDAP